jgi:hypothetical protein
MKPRSQEERAYLIARYGKSYVDGGSRWKIPAALLALIGIPWLLWSAGYHSQPTLRHELISFEVIDDSKISITYLLERNERDLEVICTLVARDFEKNIIGEVADRFTANAAPGRMVRTSTIPTRIKAVNADVIHCDVR